ncbi:MAG: tetratricopeptide repeat protein [bacterium]
MKRAAILAVLLFQILVFAAQTFAAGFSDRYDTAYRLFERGRYTQAIRDFRNLLNTDASNDLSDNCQYWLGECYFQLGRYDQALVEFDRTLSFPGTNKREDALFKIAQCHEALGETTLAGELYVRFLADYPQSRHAPAVLKKLENIGLL